MKQKFTTIPGCHIIGLSESTRVLHCTRCGTEYPSAALVYGKRDGDDKWNWFCAQDNCYGRSPQDIYTVTVESA